MTEEQKYQGSLYQNKNKKAKLNPTASNTETNMTAVASHHSLPQPAYVEDVIDIEEFRDQDDEDDNDSDNDERSSDDEALPHAPTPPPPVDEEPINVFDFLDAAATPTASCVSLPAKAGDSTSLVRYDRKINAYLEPTGSVVDDARRLIQYGTGPHPSTASFETPAPRLERKKTRDSDRDMKKDKKRKRLHVDVHDHIMTDAPPVLHSGLTGGLNRLMGRPSVFPPSPEYSADAAETPASPLKKTKHSKHSKISRAEAIGNNLISMLSVKPKPKKRKHVSSVKKHHRRADGEKAPKLIEYRPALKDGKESSENQIIVYKPRADLFLSFVNKGPDSERGCSMNKALKRFHRERSSSGNSLGKPTEEKELWRSLRVRKNERGEIVLFCV